jgi:hypothetical protein
MENKNNINSNVTNVNNREEIYSSIRDDLLKKMYITLFLAKEYHERKAHYRTKEGKNKIITDMSKINENNDFEIYTLKKGKQRISDEVFLNLQKEMVVDIDFSIMSLESKLSNYKYEVSKSEQIKKDVDYESAHIEIISRLKDLKKYCNDSSWTSKSTINQISDKVKEINNTYSPRLKVKLD